MTKFLLAVHVIAAIVAIGPVTVAASMFPPFARRALAESGGTESGGTGSGSHGYGTAASGGPVSVTAGSELAESGGGLHTLRLLHRICRIYAVVAAAVPVFGFATAGNMGVLGDTWLIVSIVLTGIAAVVLGALVLPRQEALLAGFEEAGATEADSPEAGAAPMAAAGAGVAVTGVTVTERATVRLAMVTGIFNLLWATVTVLMIVRPGSTTGA
ncbi:MULTISPECIES: protease [Streptomyces]|uniref:Protease n=1 Tax=Streptomyces griseoaurantiacus TaxID=68213 RepID=A0A7W2DU63_9ACTN|nr:MULTISPECIES: protease [Streptomyces]MBA5223047.1 protease [Streptomyces griseoaurantiacus]